VFLVGRLAVAKRTDVGKTLEPACCRRTGLCPCKLKALRKTVKELVTSRGTLTGDQLKIRYQRGMKENRLIYGEVEDESMAIRILYIIQ
jgi:hypothetical protein